MNTLVVYDNKFEGPLRVNGFLAATPYCLS